MSVPQPASDVANEDDELTLAPDPDFDEPQVPEHELPHKDELRGRADEIRRSLDSAAKNVKSRITAARQPLELDKDDLDTRPRCPGCGVVLIADVVVCLECGYNRQTGRKIEPSRESEIMARAEAAVAAEAEDAEDEGLSAWFYGSALGALLLLFVVFFLIPSHILALVLALLILLAGTVLFGYGFVLAIMAGDYLFMLRILLVILLGGFRLLFIVFRMGQGGETTTLHDINHRDHEKWCIYGLLLLMFGLFVLMIGLCGGGGGELSADADIGTSTAGERRSATGLPMLARIFHPFRRRGGSSRFVASHARFANAGVLIHVEDRGPKHNAAHETTWAAVAEAGEICGLAHRLPLRSVVSLAILLTIAASSYGGSNAESVRARLRSSSRVVPAAGEATLPAPDATFDPAFSTMSGSTIQRVTAVAVALRGMYERTTCCGTPLECNFRLSLR